MAGSVDPNDKAGDGRRHRRNGHTGVQDKTARIAAQERELRERPQALLRSLSSYVNFELGRRIRLGQMDPEDLLRDEVIDTAFASALTRLGEGEPIRDLHTYLRTRAQDMIGREIRRIQQERRQHVSLEQTVAAGEETEGGEEVRIVDIIPDPNAREPEQIVIDAESLAFMLDTLADIPDLWRTVFLQRTLQERSAREVADLEGLDIDEVRRITIRTRDYLRERFELEYDLPDDE
jgi:RNA polymerase sigma factor (sigma-70 family)